jgi:uncharacterized protein related to proFAR isomerase
MNISKIEDIYREYNIHKAIIVCNIDDIDEYHKELLAKDHSVIRTEYVHLLNNIENRVLLIDLDSALLSFNRETSINLEWVSVVIYINTTVRIPALNHMPTIIL